jgi:hypothetical protein
MSLRGAQRRSTSAVQQHVNDKGRHNALAISLRLPSDSPQRPGGSPV